MTIKEKNLKLIMELIFIFILPLAVIGINCKLDNEYVYDNNGNFETSQKQLIYSGIDYNTYYENVIDNFNLWNENWELGNINTSGNNEPASDRIRSVDYISVSPLGNYYFKSNETIYVRLYDDNYNYIGAMNGKNTILTMPSNVYFIRFYVFVTYYTYDICINYSLSWANGNYVPYGKPLIIDSDINYTGNAKLVVSPFVNFKNMVAGAFNVDNTDISFNIIFDYTCLWFLQFVIWHLLYGLFDFLMHLLTLKKKE